MTLLALLISMTGLAYLAWANPKRRRAFDQIALARRIWLWPARLAVLLPGLGLAILGDWAGITIWAGAVTVLGWGVAALSPHHIARLRAETGTLLRQIYEQSLRAQAVTVSAFSSLRRRLGRAVVVVITPESSADPRRIAALEARLERLEQRLASLETVDSVPTDPPSISLARSS